jgi:hypothetical protein
MYVSYVGINGHEIYVKHVGTGDMGDGALHREGEVIVKQRN